MQAIFPVAFTEVAFRLSDPLVAKGVECECSFEAVFKTSEIQDFRFRPARILQGRVDGAIRVLDLAVLDHDNSPFVMIYEVKPAAKKLMDDGTYIVNTVDQVDSATAKEGDEQIRIRANSIHLNNCSDPIVLLSIIGCFFRPYLWMNNTIRPSNFDVFIHESRVSTSPSPTLWLDLRTDIGKRTLQQVILDVVQGQPSSAEMYGVVGNGASQASCVANDVDGGGSFDSRSVSILSCVSNHRQAS